MVPEGRPRTNEWQLQGNIFRLKLRRSFQQLELIGWTVKTLKLKGTQVDAIESYLLTSTQCGRCSINVCCTSEWMQCCR